MAATPKLKVFTRHGEYVASCKYAEDAAAVVALYGAGATIRYGHAKRDIVWTESDIQTPGDGCAGESFDIAASTINRRLRGEE